MAGPLLRPVSQADNDNTAMAILAVVNVNKPPGLTSRNVVDRVGRLIRPAKCGHAGTLDPLASGVLVVCVGAATRLTQYVQRMSKRYEATFLLGRRSPTDDTEREVEFLADAYQPTWDDLQDILPRFLGDVRQRPPAHSAVKIGGRRAYKLARAGHEVELAERTVTIHELVVRRYEYPELELGIHCGSGTYVRSLGRDMAAALGTAAVMSALVRTAVGSFRIEDAVTLDDLTTETLGEHLQPALVAVADLPRITLSEDQLIEIRHGRPIAVPPGVSPTAEAVSPGEIATAIGGAGYIPVEWAAVDAAGQLLAILHEKYPGQLGPLRNLIS
jgi:tRNA pseudouridine55 synthase